MGLWAQIAPPAYSVTQVNSMMGEPVTQKIYRSGSKAMIENPGSHTRTLYDLQAHTNFTWYTENGGECSGGTFSGDWGDPFQTAAEVAGQLKSGKQVGTETVNGFATKIVEVSADGGAKIKAWVDIKSGLVIKGQLAMGNAEPRVVLEIKQFSAATPAASLFVLPATCAAAAAAPKIPTEAERIAAETGSPATDFSNAIMGPSSKSSCAMAIRVMRAGSMQPITTGFQIALDQTANQDHMPHYTIGMSTEGHATYSGGGLREMTGQLRNGVLRIDSVPAEFYLELTFGKGGDASSLIYRHCTSPETVLLYVIKNPANISEGGDWLWVKSGKYAKVE